MKTVTELTFEEAFAELEEIVKNQASGKTKLDEAVSVYARGTELKKYCEQKLREAQMKIEQISLDKNGEVKLSEFKTND
jgi:exodeoxyribonuclease VII small subunit